MTLKDIRDLLVSAAKNNPVTHYFSMDPGHDYTYWEETQQLPLTASDAHEEGWRFYVHRYTRREFDPVADDIFRALDADPRVTVRRTTDFDKDSGYIHHIYECEGY